MRNYAVVLKRTLESHEVEVIVSRGGTAAALKRTVDIPVVTAEFGDFDVLNALWRARKMSNNIAYVSYQYPEKYHFEDLAELLGTDIKLYNYTNAQELQKAVMQAYEDGVEVVVGGGAWAAQTARSLGMEGIIVYSSRRSMYQAIERAQEIIHVRRRDKAYSERLSTIINSVSEGIVCVDERDQVVLLNRRAEELLGLLAAQAVGKSLGEVFAGTALGQLLQPRRQFTGKICKARNTDVVVSRFPVKTGADDFGHIFTFQEVTHLQQLEQKVRREIYHKGLVAKFQFSDIVGASRAIEAAVAKAHSFARTDSTVLIYGESGTGKEIFAQGIHQESARRQGPFVAINCAALPETLLESELFGYEEGSFTGARKGGKAGLFELAHGGTIFLDEIGGITPALQARLLRVLQEREVMRVGGDRVVPVDVRVIVATNRDLRRAVADGRFRHDLYFRLNVLRLNLPPLRERREDILPLLRHFIASFNKRFGKQLNGIPPEIQRWALSYEWPGNVRELENFAERLVILAEGDRITPAQSKQLIAEATEGLLPLAEEGGEDYVTVRLGTLEEMEQEIIDMVAKKMGGNRTSVADFLGISRTTLWKKLNQKSVN